MPRRRRHVVELGLMLLFAELMRFGLDNIPPVTLSTILGQTFLYMGLMGVPWEKTDVCLSTTAILKQKDYRRLFLSAVEHGDDMHLYYNMASFLLKGRSLENRYGSRNFGFILLFITFLTGLIYVGLGYTMTELTNKAHFSSTCAIGFSGVIFALKVLTTHEQPGEMAIISGIPVPGKYAAWFELILIHLLVPNSSFQGHLAGILAGLVYCKTLVGEAVDQLINYITGYPVLHGGEVVVEPPP